MKEEERTALLFLLEDLERSRQQIEQAHQEWIASMDALADPIFLHDREFRILRCNKAYQQRAGIPFHEIIGQLYYEVFPKNHEPLPCCLRAVEKAEEEEEEVIVGDTTYRSRTFSIMGEQGDYHYSVHILEDITERKRSEQALNKLNRAFKALSAGNHELVHATEEAQLLQAMCRVPVESGGYSAAWVGYKQNDAGKSVRPMAAFGFDPGYVDILQITWADSKRGRGPTGRAIRNGKTQIVQDVSGDPDCAPWHDQALKHSHASSIALPLLDDGEVFGNLTIYSAEQNAFDQEEVALLEEMADDLAYGIRMLRMRQAQQEHAEQVRMGLEGTIKAVAAMVEMRDPYTAGHQIRVADLAAAIARQMGLTEERAHGIRLAGSIHDLGKIQVPAEILSKPGNLSEVEYSLIKIHPQAGYEILKDIAFPWPIAQMVLQHHERFDGSGYPQGLKGEEISLDARIISVADTVEAMSSHRPYRPGLGLDTALEEITRQRGIHYDPQVVDACLALFREQGYRL